MDERVYSLNLRHLDALLAVRRLGNMSAAAVSVSLSQPALAQAVAKMENMLDARLFDRHVAGVQQTEAGVRFIDRVDTALRYLSRGVRRVRRAAHTPVAHLERRLTMAQLRALVAVVGSGSYAAGAAEAGLSQPALHRAMRELQDLTEVPMLIRAGRSVRPTDAAMTLVRFVRLMLAELSSAIDELAAMGADDAGHIRIGVLPVARALFLPRVLAQFCEQHPGASIEIIEGPYLELLARLRQGDMDLLIGSERQVVPARDVQQEALFVDELVIVGRAGHPLCGTPRLHAAALLRYPWVVPARGVPLRVNWERMFQVRGVEPPRLQVQCASIMIMRGLMLEGDWLSLMSRDQFLLESAAGHLVGIGSPGKDFRRRIAMTRRTEWRPTALQARFIALLRRMASERVAIPA